MYGLTVFAHSGLRWLVVALGVIVVVRAISDRGRRPLASSDRFLSLAFVAALDLQLLIGVVLFAYSPITILGRHELDLAARSHVLRFFTFIHPIVMTAAVVCAHVGYRRLRRRGYAGVGLRAAALPFAIALVLLLAGTPWPFLSYGRSLLSWPR